MTTNFIRRASLDIIGRIAKPEEIREYMKDSKETRRSKLIDRLLDSDEYPRHWANLWANWLLSRAGRVRPGRLSRPDGHLARRPVQPEQAVQHHCQEPC